MTRKLLQTIIVTSCTMVWLPAALCYGGVAAPPDVPSLDEMAGDWVPMRDVANPPDVNNFHDLLLINRDLTSFFCCPEDWLWNGKPRFGYPPIKLTIAGEEYPATECRWYRIALCDETPTAPVSQWKPTRG